MPRPQRSTEVGVESFPVEFVEANGQRFEVWTAGAADAQRLALLLHGFPEHAISWRHQMPLLAERGYRVWAPNQRGYGESSKPRGRSAYHIDHLVEDVAQLIDASGCREVFLAGHDWGAMVAWEFATRRLRLLERLAIFNVPHPARFREELRNNRRQRRKSWYVAFFQLPWIPEWFLTRRGGAALEEMFLDTCVHRDAFPPEVLEVYRRNVLAPGSATAMLNWYRAAAREVLRTREYSVIETPTLLVWGERDVALTKATALGTERYVANLTRRFLPDASHWVQQDAPEEVNAILAAWLDGERAPGRPD